MDCFNELDTDRPDCQYGVARIRWKDILEYAAFKGIYPKNWQAFTDIIREMENTFIKWTLAERKRIANH